MFSNKLVFFLRNTFSIFLILTLIQSCGAFKFKRADVKDVPVNDAQKRERNIKEGRGLTLPGSKGGKSGNFDFATSNEMWRATIEVLDFVPLTTADYGGGIIITDWYSDNLDSQESIKIMVNFLSNEIRADGLEVKIYKKICNDKLVCNTQLMTSELNNEIKLAVLKKAAQIKNISRKKRAEESDYEVTPSLEQ